MPLTPLAQIESYAALSGMLDRVEQMSSGEIYDPEALTTLCASIASAAAQAAHDTVGRVTLEGAVIVNQMLGQKKLTPQQSSALLPEFIGADLSEQEIVLISSIGTSWYNIKLLLRVSRMTLLVGAFIVSFLSEQWLREDVLELPNDPQDMASRVIVAALVFLAQLLLFGHWGKVIDRYVQWKIFHRTHRQLLAALGSLMVMCSRTWQQTNGILLKVH